MSGEKKIERRVERLFSLDDPRFLHELGVLLGPQFVGGNRHTVLQNGDEIFPAMLAAIHGAQTSITFETYIYWVGDIGREFALALSERARHGVKNTCCSTGWAAPRWMGNSSMSWWQRACRYEGFIRRTGRALGA